MGPFSINKNKLINKIEFLLEKLFPVNRSLTGNGNRDTLKILNENEPDAGDIIHQLTPDLKIGDGIHDVACKVVISAAADAVKLIDKFKKNRKFKKYKQKGTGKNFSTNDFKPEHIIMLYNVYNNDIVDYYLKGSLKCKKSLLFKHF
ncbi:MAG: hypothetical protein CMG57_09685 [Candidatus Marinimicrobia bacterium]|nr:hypothetical protein [Candidatus Neomarinimicrobiota bacterium]